MNGADTSPNICKVLEIISLTLDKDMDKNSTSNYVDIHTLALLYPLSPSYFL